MVNGNNINFIVTHDGVFHGDEVMATAIIKTFRPHATVFRSRDPETWKIGDIVLDVGGGEFDHHQRGFDKRRESTGTPYATAGLVWDAYCKDYCQYIGVDDLEMIAEIKQALDRSLMEPIDLQDNGNSILPSHQIPYGLSGIISAYNPTWLCDSDKNFEDYQFEAAVEMTTKVLRNQVDAVIANVYARTTVEKLASEAEGQVMVMPRFMPWQNTLSKMKKDILYVMYPGKSGDWVITANRTKVGESFINRKSFPVAWRGLQGSDLQKVTGVETAVFCHNGGFIASAKTFEDAARFCALALASDEPEHPCN